MSEEASQPFWRPSAPAWLLYLVLASAATGVYFLISGPARIHVYVLIGLSMLAALLVGIRRNRPNPALPWYVIAFGLSLFVAGDVVYFEVYEILLGIPAPYPSIADLCYQCSYVVTAVGLTLLIHRSGGRRDWSGLIDAGVIAAALGILAWVILMQPYSQNYSITLLVRLFSMAAPLLSLLWVVVAVRLWFAIRASTRPAAFYLLVTGILLHPLGDVVHAYLVLNDAYNFNLPINATWMLSYAFFGAAALHPTMREFSQTPLRGGTGLTRPRLVLLGTILLMVLVLQLLDPSVMIAAGSTILILLLIARIWGLVEALRRSEERSRSSFRDAAIGMALVGTDGHWLQVNRSLCEMLGHSEEELLSRTFKDISHPDDLDVSVRRVGELLEGKREGYQLEKRYLHADGHPVWAALSVSAVRDPEGTPLYLISQMQDITERKKAEEKIEEAEERYRTLVERIPVVTYIQELSPRGRTTYLSPQYQSIKGYSREEVLSEPGHWIEILHPDDREWVLAEDERTDQTGEPFSIEYRQIAKDGRTVWIRDEATLVHNEGGEPLYWLGIQTDVTERKALEERLEHQALHDSLTDLPNRRLFVDRLGQALRRARRRGRGVAVLFLDLDGFKNINDTFGHETGDDLLVAAAERLKGCLRAENTLARFGGDEFVVLLEDAVGPDEPVRVAERIARELGGPFVLGGNELYVGASIGVAMGGERTKDPGELLRDADTAMYRAKEEGSGYSVFDPAMHEQALSRLELENDLRHALENGEFTLYYQPKFRLGHPDRIEQVEALVRWEHPQKGFMLPDDFLPIAQEMGLIIPIDEWVMKEACRQAKEWQGLYPSEPSLSVGVNLSAGQVRDPGLLQEVRSALRESGLAPGSLILEITEGILLKDTQEIETVLGEVKALGVRLEIDDFGKEYSSLSYLNRLPVDGLKIDRLFLESFAENPSNMLIVEAVTSLAHSLGLEVTGEGVQSAEQLELLRGMGCDFVQGYHLARPLPKEEVEQLLADLCTNRRDRHPQRLDQSLAGAGFNSALQQPCSNPSKSPGSLGKA